jgi:hypothetical protein
MTFGVTARAYQPLTSHTLSHILAAWRFSPTSFREAALIALYAASHPVETLDLLATQLRVRVYVLSYSVPYRRACDLRRNARISAVSGIGMRVKLGVLFALIILSLRSLLGVADD